MRLQGGGGRYSSIIMKTSKNVRHYKLKNPSNNKTKLPPLPPYTYCIYTPHLFRTKLLLSLLYVHTHTNYLCVCVFCGGCKSPGRKRKCKWSVRSTFMKEIVARYEEEQRARCQSGLVRLRFALCVERRGRRRRRSVMCVFLVQREEENDYLTRGGGREKGS